jgi:hypothetical protein
MIARRALNLSGRLAGPVDAAEAATSIEGEREAEDGETSAPGVDDIVILGAGCPFHSTVHLIEVGEFKLLGLHAGSPSIVIT